MKVALLKGQSQYGALGYFTYELARALAARGIDAAIIALETVRTGSELAGRLRELAPLGLVFSFNTPVDCLVRDGHALIEMTGAPHVVQFVDHPLHHIDRLKRMSRDTAILVVDHSHQRTIKTLFGPDHFVHVAFNPHGALGEPCPLPGDVRAFVAERPIAALFAGSIRRPDKPAWDEFPEFVKRVFAAATDAAMSREWLPALEALDSALADFGLDPRGKNLPPEVTEELRSLREAAITIHDWIRSERRWHLVEAAARAGLPLTMVGSGAEADIARFANIDHRGAVTFEETLRLMRQARMVLNVNANFGEGSHERPLTAMLAGAAVASDASTFYAQAFADGHDIALFRWTSLESDLAAIAARLRDDEAVFEMAKAGQRKVLEGHRWVHRVDNILAAARETSRKLASRTT